MTCRACHRWLSQKRDGALAPRWERELADHLHACDACRAYAAWLETLPQAACRSDLQAPAHFNAGVWRRIESRRTRRFRPRSGAFLLLGAAAAASLVVLVVRPLHHDIQTHPQVASQLTPPQEKSSEPAVQPAPPSVSMRTEHVAPLPIRRPESEPQDQGEPALSTQAAQRPSAAVQAPAVQARPGAGQPPSARPPAENASQPALRAAASPGAASSAPGVQFRLYHNKLNLARNERCRLEVTLDASGRIYARIFTREGKMVRILADETVPAGTQTFEWDGRLDHGSPAATGIYILVVQAGQQERRFKIAVIK